MRTSILNEMLFNREHSFKNVGYTDVANVTLVRSNKTLDSVPSMIKLIRDSFIDN